MSNPRPARRNGGQPATVRLRDLALDDRERAFYGPRTGDWLLLGLMVVILLGNGAYIWHQTGAGSRVGRAAFFGLLLLCVLWSGLVYTFKLSVCVRVGPQGLSVVRGPWRTELSWREVARLTERRQLLDGQPYRWLVALARDERKMQIRDDMVNDYARFRLEVFERYRLWRDHGGTWGTTGGGPYAARETLAGQTFWAAVGAAVLALPAIYFLTLLPETDPLGWVLLFVAAGCAGLSAHGVLRRRTYMIDAKAIETRRATRTLRLAWRDVTKVERARHAFGGVISMGIALGRVALKLAAWTDGRVESFDWSPRVPEYLTLRGRGHLVRVRLHRLERPDELLAWVEFYERVGRRAAESAPARKTGDLTHRLAPALPLAPPLEPAAADLTDTSGPVDPWGAGREGEPESYRASSRFAQQAASGDSWLSDETPEQLETAAPTPAPFESGASTIPPFPVRDDQDLKEQSLSGLDIFASRPAAEATPPRRFQTPGRWQAEQRALPSQSPMPEAHSATPPSPAERHLWTPGSAESWQPQDAIRQWPRGPEAESLSQGMDDDWLAEEVEPEMRDDTLEDASDGLTEPIAPWQNDAGWQRPQLPRFGPPAPHGSREDG